MRTRTRQGVEVTRTDDAGTQAEAVLGREGRSTRYQTPWARLALAASTSRVWGPRSYGAYGEMTARRGAPRRGATRAVTGCRTRATQAARAVGALAIALGGGGFLPYRGAVAAAPAAGAPRAAAAARAAAGRIGRRTPTR